jgi:hypothetical protein
MGRISRRNAGNSGKVVTASKRKKTTSKATAATSMLEDEISKMKPILVKQENENFEEFDVGNVFDEEEEEDYEYSDDEEENEESEIHEMYDEDPEDDEEDDEEELDEEDDDDDDKKPAVVSTRSSRKTSVTNHRTGATLPGTRKIATRAAAAKAVSKTDDPEDDEEDVDHEEDDKDDDKKPAAVSTRSSRKTSVRNRRTGATLPAARKTATTAAAAKAVTKTDVENSAYGTKLRSNDRETQVTVTGDRGVTIAGTASTAGRSSTSTGSTARRGVTNPRSASTAGAGVVVRDLASFGLIAAPPGVAVEGNAQRQNRSNSSILRVAVVQGVDGRSDIILRCEPTEEGTNTCSWSEKVFADSIRNRAPWTTQLNISEQTFNSYVNNTMELNANGFPIRLFHIPVMGRSSEEELIALCTHISELVSTTPRNNERLYVDRRRLYWKEANAVWSDIIGNSKALQMIRFHKGNTYSGFFEEHEQFILTYFTREDAENIGSLFPPVAINI